MSYSRAMMRMMLGLALVALVGGCDEKKDAPAPAVTPAPTTTVVAPSGAAVASGVAVAQSGEAAKTEKTEKTETKTAAKAEAKAETAKGDKVATKGGKVVPSPPGPAGM